MPELVCEKCGQKHAIWFTDNALWNEVIGREPHHFLCPTCFTDIAEKYGIGGRWEVRLEKRAISEDVMRWRLER